MSQQATIDDLAELARIGEPEQEPREQDQKMSEAERPDLLAAEHEVTVEDVRALTGAVTPHFALQVRNRIRRLIEPLPAGPPGPGRGRAEDRRAGGAGRPQRRAAWPLTRALAGAGAAAARRPRPATRRASSTPALPTSTCSTRTSSRPAPTQDLMTSGFVPKVYERYWRPALGRVAKGFTGPGMAEEIRIARLLLGPAPGRRGARRRLRPRQLLARLRPGGRRLRPRRRARRLADDARARRRRPAPVAGSRT